MRITQGWRDLSTRAAAVPRPIAIGAGIALAGIVIGLVLGLTLGGGSSSTVYRGVPVSDANAFWRSVDPDAVAVSTVSSPGGGGVEASLGRGRTSYTALQWTFSKQPSFFGHRWLYLEFRGRATGATYTFFIDFNGRHRNSAGYTLVDTSSSWQAIPLDLSNPYLGKPPFDLRHVVSVRLTTDSKDQQGTIDVGRLSLSPK